MGEVVHEEPENGAEVVLRPGHRHLDGNWRLRVAVAAGTEEIFPKSRPWGGGEGSWGELGVRGHLQSLYARDDGVEGGLDVGGGAGADHREAVVLEHVREVLGGEREFSVSPPGIIQGQQRPLPDLALPV